MLEEASLSLKNGTAYCPLLLTIISGSVPKSAQGCGHTAPPILHAERNCQQKPGRQGFGKPQAQTLRLSSWQRTTPHLQLPQQLSELTPFYCFFFPLFSKVEQSHSVYRKIKPGIGECADRAMNCPILNSERPREKRFDVGRMGTELDKKHARTGWPTNQVVFRDYKQ